MWNSVSRAFSYGWSVGLTLIRKMSDKIFETKSIGEEDVSFVTEKMAEDVESSDRNKISEQLVDQKQQPRADNDQPSLSTIQTSVVYDSLDETLYKSNGANSGLRRMNKSTENHGKTTFAKSDNRSRQKMSSDVRWNHVGNVSSDFKWYNSEKLEKSQSDLSSSKWFSNADSNMRSDSSLKNTMHILNSSESDIFPSRSGISNNPNEISSHRPHPLFKSSSSSQLPSIRGNCVQSTRQWKYGSNSTTRPISVISMQQSYAPNTLYFSNHSTYGRNTPLCYDSCGKKNVNTAFKSYAHGEEHYSNLIQCFQNRTESFLSLAEDSETPEGLSWRRLHMSRAKLKATATTSELLSGFAMVAMVELQINKPTAVPEWLFVLFAVCTTILVSVHIFALMISTYLLPNIDAVSKLHVSSLVNESPHDRMKSFIELAWAFSTILGLFLFLVEIAILCWVKFWDYSFTAAMSATMIIMPVLVLFVAFAMHFYHSLVVIKCKTSTSNMQELENMKKQLDNVSPA